MHIIQLYLWDYVNVVLWCKFTRTSQRKMTWYNIHTHTHIHSCTSCWNGPGALHSEQSTVRACAYVSFLLARIHREAIKPRSQAKSQSMGSSLIDNSLEEDWKASFVKKIARATAEQNDIIVCYLRLLCHWANVLKPAMFGIRGERRSNTSSHGTLCCRDGSLRYAADLMDFMVCPVFAPAGCSPEHFANWNEAETCRSFGQDAYFLNQTCSEIFLVDCRLTLKRHWLTECRIKPVDGWKSVRTGGDSDASARAKTHVHKSFIYSTFWAPQAAQKRLGVDILPRGPFSVEGFRWRHKTEIEVNPDLDVPRKTEFKHLWVQENQENSICWWKSPNTIASSWSDLLEGLIHLTYHHVADEGEAVRYII